jgi:hypothetical protein
MPAPYLLSDITTKLITRVSPESSPGTVEETQRAGIQNLVKRVARESFTVLPKTGFTDGALKNFLAIVESRTTDSVMKNRISTWRGTLSA